MRDGLLLSLLGELADVTDEAGKKHPALVALGQQKGISQEDFAAQAGLGRSYYGGIERGERNVAALNLMRIASALGVEAGDLFPEKQTMNALLTERPVIGESK